MKEEIAKNRWVPFLDEFSRAHEGWLVSVDVFELDRTAATEADEQPLMGITADHSGNRPSVSVVVGHEPDGFLTHVIEGVERLRLNRTGDGTEEAIEIQDGEGRVTTVRLRTAIAPEMVDGIAGGLRG
jgi:hypothetical protein